LEIRGRAKRRIIRRRLREFVEPRPRVRVGLTEGGDIVSVPAVGVSPLTFDDSESLVQSVKVYTVVIGLRGVSDIVKCPVLIVVIVRVAVNDLERRGSLASFPPQGTVHLSVRFALAEKLDVPGNSLKMEWQRQPDRLPDICAVMDVTPGGTVDPGEQGGKTFPWHQQSE
jgi:hypothetical protein